MPLILGANSVSGYTVKNSLRFNSGSSDYLSRTPASTTNRRTFTFSGWVKRGNSGVDTTILGTSDTTAALYNLFAIRFTSADEFRVSQSDNTGGVALGGSTNALYRDPSAWYHIVVAIDTTQASSSNGFKCYINGSQVTFQSVGYTQNLDTSINSTSFANYIGRSSSISPQRYFSGYQSEVYFIDGQQLTPSSFGETDTDTGIWKPKAYTGTYGTNGFYLQFKNSASLGTDSSGNGNNWTVNNLTSIDQTTDTPTNNFCTINPLDTNTSVTLSQGNLKQVCSSTSNDLAYATIGVAKGKWYWEIKIIDVDDIDGGTFIGGNTFRLAMNGTLTGLTASGTAPSGFADGDYMAIGLDVDNARIQFYKNGSVNGDYCTITGTFDFIIPRNGNNRHDFEFNFGNPPFTIASGNTDGAGYGNFEYAVPSGYYALCTKNLANFG